MSTKKNSNHKSNNEKRHSIKWALIVPALVIVLCMALFVVASQAGWLQTFLTPEEKLLSNLTTTETTTPEPTTTKEKPTTTRETTTEETTEEETTEEFIPSTYIIDVNLSFNKVIVYTRGEKLNDGLDPKDPNDDEYEKEPVIAFSCSTGTGDLTPRGRFHLQDRAAWCFMYGDVYTQYATRITDDIMFHSIPYYSQDPGDIETYQYNILGYDASSGCVRLNCRDARWIFFNCPIGTEVNIFRDYYDYGPLTPEPTYRIPEDLPPLSGWDPTDTTSYGNPWLTYSPSLSQSAVTLPVNSSPDDLLSALGPTDEYGNDLSKYFYTDGGYSLWVPGVYETTGHIDIGNLELEFPIQITVTEDYSAGVYGYDTEDYEEESSEEPVYDPYGYDGYTAPYGDDDEGDDPEPEDPYTSIYEDPYNYEDYGAEGPYGEDIYSFGDNIY